jgi:hypothetical protein
MHPFLRLILVTCLVSGLATAPRIARAEAPGRPVVAVSVPPGEPELDAPALRAAIGAELGDEAVPPDDPRAAGAVGAIRVSIDRRAHALVVAYRGPNEPITRTVDLPGDRASVERAAVLLAGNLARDEAGDLAASLRTRRPAPEGPSEKDATDARDLDLLGETLAQRQDAGAGRRIASVALFGASLAATGVVGGELAYSVASHRRTGSADADFVLLAAGQLFLDAGVLLQPGDFEKLHEYYLEAQREAPPEVAREAVTKWWVHVARRERRFRLVAGGVETVLGGLGTVGGGILTVLAWEGKGSSVVPDLAFVAVMAAATASGIFFLATDGPVEAALHDYERTSSPAAHAERARASISPFIAPAAGGGMAGLMGRF